MFCVYLCRLSYDMCTQKTPYNWSALLYEKHGKVVVLLLCLFCYYVHRCLLQVIGTYLCDTVFPSIKACTGIYLLREVERRWNNHVIMNLWLRNFFMYLVSIVDDAITLYRCHFNFYCLNNSFLIGPIPCQK